MKRLLWKCSGTITGASSSASGPWLGYCDTCGQTIRMGTAIASPHYAEVELDEGLAAMALLTGDFVEPTADLPGESWKTFWVTGSSGSSTTS